MTPIRLSPRFMRLSLFTLCILGIFTLFGLILDSSHADWAHPEYHWRYPIFLGLLLVVLLGQAVGFNSTRRRATFKLPLIQKPTPTLVLIAALSIFIGFVIFLLPSSRNHPFIAVIQTYFFISSIFTCLLLLRQNELSLSQHQTRLFFISVVALALIVSIAVIGRVPEVISYDEPGEVNLAYYKIKDNRFLWPLYPTLPPVIVAIAWGVPLDIAGYWMQIVGAGVVQMRIVSLAFAWLALPFIFVVARSLYGQMAALCAVMIGAFIPIFHNYARPDSFVALSLSVTLACVIQARTHKQLLWHYLAGLSVAFGIEAHPYALRFVVAFGVLYLLAYFQDFRQTRRGHRAFWSFVAGGLTFGLIYLVLHVLSVPPEQRASNFIESLTATYRGQTEIANRYETVSVFQRILQTNTVMYAGYFRIDTTEALLFIAVIILAIARRNNADKLLLSLLGISFLVGSVLIAHASIHYWLYNLPFLAIFAGAAIARLGKTPQTLGYLQVTVIAIVASAFVAQIAAIAIRPQAIDSYLEIGRKIDRLLPENAHIVGRQLYSLSMIGRRNYVDIENYYGDKNFIGGPNITAYMQPDTIIYSSGGGYLDDPLTGLILPYIRQYNLKPAYCFNSSYGDDVIVYLKPEWLPPNPDLTACALPE